MAEKKRAEEMEVTNRKNERVSDWKGKFNEILSKIVSNDSVGCRTILVLKFFENHNQSRF